MNDAPPDSESDAAEAQPGSITISGSFSWTDPEGREIRPIQDEPKKKKQRKSKRATTSASELSVSISGSVAGSIATEATSTPVITLRDLECTIESGQLVAVVGAVGTGKSSFLSTILGEMEPVQGSAVYRPQSEDCKEDFVSYCAQSPWVVNDTLRGNILFGREFDQERYDTIIEVCALEDDLIALPAGDMTEIGERGINLSGGQKARVSLARALYAQQTRIVLMVSIIHSYVVECFPSQLTLCFCQDDPLSAVDAHVGEHIFSQAIAGPFAKGLTRVLVTHHVHLLARCDKVIVLKGGRISHQGKYKDLVEAGVNFAGAVDVSKVKISSEPEKEEKENPRKGEEKKKPNAQPALSDEKKEALKKSGKKLVKEEEREEGSVDGSAYMHYARAGGLLTAAGVFLVQGLGRAFEIGSSFWLAFWAKKSFEAASNGTPHSNAVTNEFLGIYALFGFVGIIGLTGRSLLIAVHRLRASRMLHDNLTESILRAPVSFFVSLRECLIY